MAQDEVTLIHRITTWITPGLIVIISYLLKADIDYVKEQLKTINSTNIELNTLKGRVDAHEFRINSLENRHNSPSHTSYSLIGKHEEVISLSNLTN